MAPVNGAVYSQVLRRPAARCSFKYQAERSMREIVLITVVAMVVAGGVVAAWFITQPPAAAHAR